MCIIDIIATLTNLMLSRESDEYEDFFSAKGSV